MKSVIVLLLLLSALQAEAWCVWVGNRPVCFASPELGEQWP